MLENGAVTKTDMFSFTMAGARWINVKWLYEVVIGGIEKLLGPHGVMLLQSLVNVAIVLLLLRMLQLFAKQMRSHISTLYTTIAVLLFLAVSEFRMAGRPEMVSHLLMVIYMLVLWHTGAGYSWKKIAWLIPLQCLWANMHEGYPVGMVLTGVYVAGAFLSYFTAKDKMYLQAATRLAIVWAGMALVILLNPNGIQLWKQPFEIFRQLEVNKYTTELLSYTTKEYWSLQAQVHHAIFLLVAAYWIYRLLQHKRGVNKLQFTPVLTGYLLSLPVLEYLSLTANRNIPFAQLALFITVPVMLLQLAALLKFPSKPFYQNTAKKTVLISTALAVIFYISIVSNKYYALTASPNKYGLHINTLHNPTGAAEFIRKHNLQSPAFSDYFVSSYLLWSLYPQFKSYIDLRGMDVFSKNFSDDYLRMSSEPSRFYVKDSVYKFNYVVISTSQLAAVQQQLYWGEGFNVVYIDPVSVIMVRNVKEFDAINQSQDAGRLFTWPQEPEDPAWAEALTKMCNPTTEYTEEDEINAPIHAARFYNSVRNPRISMKMLEPAVNIDLEDNAEAHALLGQAYFMFADYAQTAQERKNRWDSAGIYFLKAIEMDEQSYPARIGLGTLALVNNDYAKAKEHFEYCLDSKQADDVLHFLYGVVNRYLWQVEKNNKYRDVAIIHLEKSVAMNKANQKAHLYLAEAYMDKGEKEQAKKHMLSLTSSDMPFANQEKQLFEQLKKQTGVTPPLKPKDIVMPGHTHDHEHNH